MTLTLLLAARVWVYFPDYELPAYRFHAPPAWVVPSAGGKA